MDNENYIGDNETEAAIKLLEVQAINFATRFIRDSRVRIDYMRITKEMAKELTHAYKSGQIKAKQAIEAANGIRNGILEFMRARSTLVGLKLNQ